MHNPTSPLLALLFLILNLTHAFNIPVAAAHLANPNTDAEPPRIHLNTHSVPICGGHSVPLVLTPFSGCTSLGALTQSLAVKKVEGGAGLRYNSLRVYHQPNCTGGWSLEPALTCVEDGCACSDVTAYKSVEVVV